MTHKWNHIPKGKKYWDILCENDAQRKLLARIRKNKLGQLTEFLYDEDCFRYDDDDFEDIIWRIGYQVGLYWQDYEEYRAKGKYPDNIKPSSVRSADKWVKDAEDVLGIPHNTYF